MNKIKTMAGTKANKSVKLKPTSLKTVKRSTHMYVCTYRAYAYNYFIIIFIIVETVSLLRIKFHIYASLRSRTTSI